MNKNTQSVTRSAPERGASALRSGTVGASNFLSLNWIGLFGFLVLVGLAGCGSSSSESGCFLGFGPDCPPAPPPPPLPPPDTTPPRVLSVSPEASAKYVNRDTTIDALFDRSLDPSSVTTSNF